MDTYFALRRERQKRAARKYIKTKPRRACPECGKWTTALYMHMIFSHEWNEQQVNELKMTLRNERLSNRGYTVYECHRCKTGYTTPNGLAAHLVICRRIELKGRNPSAKVSKEKQFEYSIDGSGRQLKQLQIRPPILPPLPEQLSVSDRGSVLCPVPRCGGRFTNHDSLSYHCMIEHSELGAAGTPQNFAIRQYRFETKDEFKEWLYERCEETCTSFSTKTSMFSGYAMYRCNRAGPFKASGTIRSGCTSKKTQTHCSAFLRTIEYTDGSVDVTCCFGHIFHELDPTALRLNERQCGVLRKALEEKKCLIEICAQMRAEYPPTNRLHYTTSNDIRNLALRVGLPVHVTLKRGDKSSAEKNSEAGEDVQDVDNVVDDVSDIVQSEGYSSAHSDLEIDEELSSVHEKHGNEQDQHQEHYFLDEQTVEAKSPSPTSSVKASSSSDDTESRPSRMRRAPRRFVDD